MKLYYCPQTRAFTSLWMMEEAGQPYELVRVDIRAPGHPTEAYKKINPMGKGRGLRGQRRRLRRDGGDPALRRRQIPADETRAAADRSAPRPLPAMADVLGLDDGARDGRKAHGSRSPTASNPAGATTTAR